MVASQVAEDLVFDLKGDYSSDQFLQWLKVDSETYGKIVEPKFEDWRENSAKRIYFSLLALKIFNVTISRPFIMAMFEAFAKRKIRHRDFVIMLENIEKFHFIFNSICSQRASGVENSYSSYSRKLLSVANRAEGKGVLQELTQRLQEKVPSEETFVAKFIKLKYTSRYLTDKKLIQYVFFKSERHHRGNDELIPLDMTLEHILPQASGTPAVGFIGNLLPLGTEHNAAIDRLPFSQKLPTYAVSNFLITRNFSQTEAGRAGWSEDDISARSLALAETGFREIWQIGQL